MVVHLNLSERRSPMSLGFISVFWPILIILISKSSRTFTNILVTVLSASITIRITVTLMLHIRFSHLASLYYITPFSLSFSFNLQSAGRQKSIIIWLVIKTSIDKIRENGFELTKKRSRRYPAKTITDADYADDIAILANTPDQAVTLLHSLERAAAGIGLYVNAHKTEYMCYNQTGTSPLYKEPLLN